jgi:hypothetical protein
VEFGVQAAHAPARQTVVDPVHDPHDAPLLPQVAGLSFARATQLPAVPPLQQPPPHEFESHAHVPFVVSHAPAAHGLHALPAVPHWPPLSDAHGTHVVPPAQQPLAHELPSHTHCPVLVLHSWPVAQVTDVHAVWLLLGWQLWQALLGLVAPDA